jgi:hypothetical protein
MTSATWSGNCSRPSRCASACRSTHCEAVADSTWCPAWQRRMARWVLPVSGVPEGRSLGFPRGDEIQGRHCDEAAESTYARSGV